MKFSEKVGNGPVNKSVNFGSDPDHHLDTGIDFRIRHYWEIGKVVNGYKSASHSDSQDGGTGKTCLGGGMRCPSVSGLSCTGSHSALTGILYLNDSLPLSFV